MKEESRLSKIEFSDVWEQIGDRIFKTAQRSLNYSDAQDFSSRYSVEIWRLTETKEYNDLNHACANFLKRVHWRIVDYIREMERTRIMLNQYAEDHQHEYHYWRDTWIDIRLLDTKYGLGPEIKMMVQGYSYSEIAIAMSCSKATVSRRINAKTTQIREATRAVHKTGTERAI